jgi:hypothetical protein
VCPELLSQGGQDGHVASGPTFGVNEVNLRRVAVEMEILDTHLDKLAHPRTGQEQRFDHQPMPAATAVRSLDQALDFEAIKTVDTAPASPGCCEIEVAAHVLDDVLGLVIAEPVLAP